MKQMHQLIPIANTSAFLMLVRCAWFDAYSCYVEVPFDDALLFLYSKAEENSEALPEKMAEKRENLDKLQIAFASLTDDEKELIWLLYLCKEPLTETQVASVLHISQPAVHKRKKKILEKMKSFWL